MPRGISRDRVSGVYVGVGTSAAAYAQAYQRLYQQLIPVTFRGLDRRLAAALDALPRTYRGFRFALIASEEHASAFLETARSFGITRDNLGRPVLGFGYDIGFQRGTVLRSLEAAGAVISPNLRRVIQGFDASMPGVSAESVFSAMQSSGFSITYAQARNLFDVSIDSTYEGRVSNLFGALPDSVERAVALDAVQNGLVRAGADDDPDGGGQTRHFIEAYKAGRFEEAYVILALTDRIGNFRLLRNFHRAGVLGLRAPGQNESVTLQSALDFANALERWSVDISQKQTSLATRERNEFDRVLTDLRDSISPILATNGLFVSFTGTDTLSSIAASTRIPLANLTALYSSAPRRYDVIFLPQTTPTTVNGTISSDGAATGRIKVVADIGGVFRTFEVARGERPATTQVYDALGRGVGAIDGGQTFSIGRTGSAVNVTLSDGSVISYTSTLVNNNRTVTISVSGRNIVRPVTGNNQFIVSSEGAIQVTNTRSAGEYSSLDLQNVPGFDSLQQLRGFGGRVLLASLVPVGAPSLRGIIDPDGAVTTTETVAADGKRTVTNSFYRDNGGEGVGDAIVQVVEYSASTGRPLTQSITRVGQNETIREIRRSSGVGFVDFDEIKPEITIEYPNQLITIEQLGNILGSTIGKRIAGKNVFGQIAASAVLSTIAGNLGEIADNILNNPLAADGVSRLTVADKIDEAVSDFGSELLDNFKSAGIGAISAFLTAELFDAIGIRGVAGELGQAVAGSFVAKIIEALPGLLNNTTKLKDVLSGVNVGNIVGSFLGSRLASSLVQFDSIGGQIGASVGSAVLSIVGTKILGKALGAAIGGPLGAFAGAFLGQILGGLIGSIFGGTPRSGADVTWDASERGFKVANVYAKKGGSKQAASDIASTVSVLLNAVIESTNSAVIDPDKIQSGNYGTRGSSFVYRPVSTRDKDAITATFKNTDQLIVHGSYLALSDLSLSLRGGDVYVKRALASSLANANGNAQSASNGAAGSFRVETLTGDISIGVDYSMFLANERDIRGILAAEPTSDFSTGWVITLQRANELGLNRRWSIDWNGGFASYLDEVNGEIDGISVAASLLEFRIDDVSKARYAAAFSADGSVAGYIEDTVLASSITQVLAGAQVDLIDLRTGSLADQRNYTVNGHLNNDIAVSGSDFTAQTSTSVSFAAGTVGSGLATDLRKSVSVALAADGIAEAAETFLGQLSNGTGASIIGGAAEATIIDGTAAKPTLLVGRSYALEGDGFATFRLSLSKAQASAVTVSLLTAAVNATAGTAAGADYNPDIQVSTDGGVTWSAAVTNPSATFAAGATEIFVRVAVLTDNGVDAQNKPTNVEGNERFTLTATVTAGAASLANVADATTGLVSASGTGTIVDASVGTTPLAWIDSVSVDEATGQAVFSIGRSRAGTAASLNFSTADQRELVIDVAATVDAGDGDDTVYASNLGDNVFGGAGNDTLYGGRLDDWLLGGDGNDVLNAGTVDAGTLGGDGNYLNGGAGNDLLIGREGSDWLEGGDGADILEGGDGGDILAGGGGAGDISHGGRGDDQYIYRIGDAADEIRDESGISLTSIVRQAYNGSAAFDAAALDGTLFLGGGAAAARGLNNWHGGGVQVSQEGTAAGGEDALVLGAGISIEDVKISKSVDGKDLIVALWPDGVFAGDQVVLKDWFNAFNKIETLRFADGNEIRLADFDTFILGSNDSETIIGTAGNDFVHAGAGDDIVYLLSGNDFGNGGLGNDSVSGDSGNDIVVGADGDDTLYGGSGRDSVSGGRGNDRLTGDEGNDILAGGTGDDEVIGGSGDDVFKFQRGDGRDVLIDALTEEWVTVWLSGSGGQNGYSVNSDGTITHATLGTLFDGQVWSGRTRYNIETGVLQVHRPANAAITVANSGTDTLEFGIGIDINDIQFRSAGNDLIIGIEGSGALANSGVALADQIVLKEWLSTAKGSIERFVFFNTGVVDTANTELRGGTDSDDTLVGVGAKKNWITGGAGDDNITGAELDDILNGNSGADTLSGAGGADVLLGGVGNDTLIGGAGADRLIGGDGLDIAAYDTAVIASLTTPANNSGDAAGDVYDSIEGLRGSAGADSLEGDYGENDLRGGQGNDILKGASGDDLYTFARGDGTDTILDVAAASEIVVLDAGTLGSPYVATVQLVDREGAIYQFEHIITDTETGEIIYRNEVTNTVGASGFAGLDFTPPTSFAQSGFVKNADGSARFQFTNLDAGGNTTATSKAYIPVLAPGGFDTILFEDNTAAGAAPTADQTIALSDLGFAIVGNNLEITVNSTVNATAVAGGKIIIQNFRAGAALNANSGFESIQFSDGSSVNLAGLKFDANGMLLATSTDTLAAPVEDFIVSNSASLTGGFGNDTLLGGVSANTLLGGDGDDMLVGGLGGDSLQGGSGVDTVSYVGSDGTTANRAIGVTVTLGVGTGNGAGVGIGTEAEADVLIGIENVLGSQFHDTITGSDGDNILKGNRGDDILTGGTSATGYTSATSIVFALGNDVLIGDDGNDNLRGGVGEDNLDGGTGNDILEGGGDRDVLAGGDGDDILRGDSSTTTTASTNDGADNVGGNLLTNASFETGTGATAADLPGWTLTPSGAFPLVTSGVTALTGLRALKLDNGSVNVSVSQTIANLSVGEILNLSFSSAALAAGASSGLEVRWNGQLVTLTPNTTSTALSGVTVAALTPAIDGNNILTFTGTGAVDGLGAVIDNVVLRRTTGAADQLIGGAGRDVLLGGAGNDVLLGGEGDDSSAFNITAGAAGFTQTRAAGLQGGAGDDILDGGAGNDTLDGGLGNDSYIFRVGSGSDTVRNAGLQATGGGLDDYIFEGIASDKLWFNESASTTTTGNFDLVITAIGQNTTVTIRDWRLASGATSNLGRRIITSDKTLARSDVAALVSAMAPFGTTAPSAWPANPPQPLIDALARWQDSASYVDRAVITGTSLYDSGTTALRSSSILIGGARYEGLAGNDTIDATLIVGGVEAVLDDVLSGGTGADILIGGKGDDQFLFTGTGETGSDTINGGEGIDSLVATVANTIINIQSLTGIEKIVSRDAQGNQLTGVQINLVSGGTLDLGAVERDGAITINGSTGIETITGTLGNDTIFGAAGNDILKGGAGNDIVRGGLGNDNLDGGTGTDTYDASDVTLTGTINLSDAAVGAVAAERHVTTGTGASTDIITGFENVIGGTAADTITGSALANRLEGRGGNDIIDGGAGDDVLIGGVGADRLSGGLGKDSASFESSTVGVTANLATNTLAGAGATGGDAAGDKFDSIENLVGSALNDSLTGDEGDNIITGGLGNDTITGGAGNDIAVFAGKFADYVISGTTVTDNNAADGNEGVDTISGIETIRFADVDIQFGIDPNNPPVLGEPPLADQSVDDGNAFIYKIPATSFIDRDLGDGIVFSARLADGTQLLPEGNPASTHWLRFDPTTRRFSTALGQTVPLSAVGTTLDVIVTATDPGSPPIEDNFLLTINQKRGADLNATAGIALAGSFRAENMIGSAGNDIFLGSAGADRIDGLGATLPTGDRVDYSASAAGITVDLKSGTASGGDAEGDTLLSIEEVYGSAFDDSITGTDGKDDLRGGAGNDNINGGLGDDLIDGGAGVDSLLGGIGNDTIYARTLVSGTLEDSVDGGNGVDELRLGGNAALGIVGSAYSAVIDLSANGSPASSIEHVVGTDFADNIRGNEFNNRLLGGLGNDSLFGGTGNDILYGGANDDSLAGEAGDDEMRGEDGNDRLIGGAGADKFYGGIGNDTVDYRASGAGVSVNLATGLASGGDAQRIDGLADIFVEIENIDGSEFADTITGDGADNILKGFAGDDVLSGGGGNDIFHGGTGNDIFDGGAGTDTIVYSGLQSEYAINYAERTIRHIASGDIDSFSASVEFGQFATGGPVTLANQAPIAGTPIPNQNPIDNAAFSFVVPAGAFTDAENDPLTYSATLANGSPLPAWLIFTAATRTFSFTSGAATPFIGQSFAVKVTASDGSGQASSNFNLTIAQGAGAPINGTVGNDTINGTFRAEVISALDGNDVINGSGGADAIDGGTGTDIISYAASTAGITVSLLGAPGTSGDAEGDTLTNIEDVDGSALADSITGSALNNIIDAGAGDDTILGGAGNDTLVGGVGGDMLRGEGGDDNLFGGSGADVIDGGTGTDYANYFYSTLRTGNDPVTTGVTADLGNSSFNQGFAANDTYIDIENLYGTAFADTLRGDNLTNVIQGDGGNDIISGLGATDLLHGQAGNDIISGDGGDDSLLGGDGDDRLIGGVGGDFIDAGLGVDTIDYRSSALGVTINLTSGTASGGDAQGDNITAGGIENVDGSDAADTITGAAGDNVLKGFAGNDTLDGAAGNDTLLGGDGNDILTGGAGADVLDGGAGIDTLDYSISSAGVTIDILANTASGGDAQGDTLVPGSFENVEGSASGDTISGTLGANVIRGNGGDDIILARDGNDTLYGGDGTDQIYGQEGDDLIYGGNQLDYLFGGSGIDIVYGEAGDDRLYGDAGNDFLYGGDGENDVLYGGSGADRLDGGLGNSDYAYYHFTDGGVAYNAGITVDLANIANNTGDAAGDSYFGIEGIIGSGGNDILRGDGLANIFYAWDGDDLISGRGGNDYLSGDLGNDTISGDDGDDTLVGGDGNDTLTGALGTDVVLGGAGSDLVHALVVGEDVIDGGADIDTVSFAVATQALLIDVTNGAHRLANIENIIGGAGGDVISGSAGVNRLEGGAGNDTIQGGAGGDTLIGGTGTDLLIYSNSAVGANFQSGLIGQSMVNSVVIVAAMDRTLNGVDVNLLANTATGADATGDVISGFEHVGGTAFADRLIGTDDLTVGNIIYGQAGDDVIDGRAGDDVLHGGDGNDIIFGGDGADQLYGGNDHDRLYGGGASDLLFGGAGNDVLDAGDAGDFLDGGTGDDILIGGAGQDHYMIARNSDNDTIYNFDDDSALDSVSYDQADNIQYSELWFTKVGKDLRVKILGGTTATTIKDWFTTTTAGDWTAADNFYVDVFVAGNRVNRQVNLAALLTVMSSVTEPASFAALTVAQQAQINSGWGFNQAPTITALGTNPNTVNEDGTINLRFTVADADAETAAVGITVVATTDGVLQTVVPLTDVRVIDANTREVTIRPNPNAFGTGNLRIRAYDGGLYSNELIVPIAVAAVADDVTLGATTTSYAINAGNGFSLEGLSAVLIDNDGSEIIDTLFLDGLAAGTVVASGANSFIASTNNASANILGWNLSTLTITTASGSGADFTLRLRGRSRDGSAGGYVYSGDNVSANITVSVNGPPAVPTLSFDGTSNFSENSVAVRIATLTRSDPDGTTPTLVLQGGDAAYFQIVNGNEVWTVANLNYEAINRATLNLAVAATDGVFTSAAWTRTVGFINVNEAPNTPTLLSDGASAFSENSVAVRIVTLTRSDVDGPVPSLRLTGVDALYFDIVNGNEIWTKPNLDFDVINKTVLNVIVEAWDGALASFGTWTRGVTFSNQNETPGPVTDANAAANTVSDGAGAGATVGLTASATDPDAGTSLTYSIIAGNALGWFAINASSGVVSVAAGATVQYETAQNVMLTIQASDGTLTSNSPFGIAITDINETPLITSTNTGSVNENLAGPQTLITLTSSDPDLAGSANGTSGHVFSIFAGDTTRFEIVGNVLRTRTGVLFDREAQASYGLTIRVRDNNNTGLVHDQAVTITVNNVNEAPTAIGVTPFGFNENVAGALVATLSAADQDVGDSFTYTVVGGADQFKFTTVGASLYLVAGQSLNFEAGPATVDIRVTDASGLTFTRTGVQIVSADVNEVPVNIRDANTAANQLFEGVAGGTGVTIQANDPDGRALNYAIVGNNNSGWFSINSATGVVSVSSAVDYESGFLTNGQITLNFEARDDGNNAIQINSVTFNVADTNETPNIAAGQSGNISETAGTSSFIGTVVSTDPDLPGSANGRAGHRYSIVGGTGFGLFSIDATNGNIFTATSGAALDYDTGHSGYTLLIRARDNNDTGLFFDQTYGVNITPVDEAPTVPSSFGISVNENSTGYLLTLGGSSDPEGATVSYAFASGGNPGGYFSLDASGNLYLNTALDYENRPTAFAPGYADVSVVATAGGLQSGIRTGRITLNNVNEAPTGPSAPPTGSIAENATGYTGITFAGGSDQDGDAVTYVFADNSTVSGKFSIVGGTHLHVNSAFDYENPAERTPSVAVYAFANGQRSAAGVTATVNVGNLNDVAPTITSIDWLGGFAGGNMLENIPVGTAIATISVADADSPAGTHTLGVSDSRLNAVWNPGLGRYELRITQGFDYEALGANKTVGFTVTVSDGVTSSEVQTSVTIGNIVEYSPVFDLTRLPGEYDSIYFYLIGNGINGLPINHSIDTSIRYDVSAQTYYSTFYIRKNNVVIYQYGDGTYYIAPTYSDTGISGFLSRVDLLPPIVLDLDGGGISLTAVDSSNVEFDVDADGIKERVAWVAATDGLLVLDRNRNGTIDNGSEISFVGDKAGAKTDLEGLAGLDSNGDGRISAGDDRFGELQIWQDLNQDGISQADELRSLTAAGIVAIDLNGRPTEQTANNTQGNIIFNTTSFTRTDGTAGLVGDVGLAYRSATSILRNERESAVSPLSPSFALDANGNGLIDRATEVFTLTAALAAFDSNSDGLITSADARYFDLRLWRDANRNDQVEIAELTGLDQAGLSVIGATDTTTPAPETGGVQPAPIDEVPPTGTETPAEQVPAVEPPPPLTFTHASFERKSGKYMIESRGGSLFVSPRKTSGPVDPLAGAIEGAMILSFKNKLYGLVTPIVLDLDGDGIDLVSAKKSKARFDLDGDGERDKTGWVGKGDGLLVIDRNGDGLITGASELSFLTERPDAASNLAALAALDSDGNGRVSASDARFGELRVWVDANRNGVSDAGEVKTLGEHAITEIRLGGRANDQQVKLGKNIVIATSTFTRSDGSTGTVGDVGLAFKPSQTPTAASNDDADGLSKTGVEPRRADLGSGFAGFEDARFEAFRTGLANGFDTTEIAATASITPGADDVRLTAMIQAMASFGGTAGEADVMQRDRMSQSGLDWLAVSAA